MVAEDSSFQIGFMKGISLPAYTLLSNILPCADILAEGTRYKLHIVGEYNVIYSKNLEATSKNGMNLKKTVMCNNEEAVYLI